MPATQNIYVTLEREQDAFDAQLDLMMKEHEGEFVLFKEGRPIAFFEAYDETYRAGLDKFGLDQTFLVSEVKKREPQTTSISWQAGVMS